MRILSFVPAAFTERIRLALEHTDTYCAVGSFSQLATEMDKGSWHAVAFDPDLLELDDIAQLKARKWGRALRLIAYTSLTKTSAAKLTGPLCEIVSGLILADYEDSPLRLRTSLCRLRSPVLGFAVLQKLPEKTNRLPTGLQRGLFDVFTGVSPLRSVKDIVVVSGFTRRSIDRWFFRVGLRPARVVLAAANLLRAYTFFLTSNSGLSEIVVASGYGSLRSLKHNSLLLIGCVPDQLVSEFQPAEMVDVLTSTLLRASRETGARTFHECAEPRRSS
jgi:hypothetical protein